MHLLQEQLRSYIVEKFPMAKRQGLSPQDDLLSSGLIDSLGILDVVSFIEQQFGVVVQDDDLVPDNFQTIDHMVGFVQRKIEGESLPSS